MDIGVLFAQLDAVRQQASEIQDSATRRRLHDSLREATYALETPQDSVHRVCYSGLLHAGARIACDLSVFKFLADSPKGQAVASLSQQTSCDPMLLHRLLNYICSHGLISEVEAGVFAPNHITHNFATPGLDASIRHLSDVMAPTWAALPAFLRQTGYANPEDPMRSSMQLAHNTMLHPFAWLHSHPSYVKDHDAYMGSTQQGMKTWVDVFPFAEYFPLNAAADELDPERVWFVDVGGGRGDQCVAFKKHVDAPRGLVVLEDLPGSVEGALELDGLRAIGHDFFTAQPVKGARAYFLRHIIHDHPDSRCHQILAHIRDAMSSDSILIMDDLFVPDYRPHHWATIRDLTMMSSLAAMERNESQWKAIVEGAGLEIVRVFCYEERSGESVIVARLKGEV